MTFHPKSVVGALALVTMAVAACDSSGRPARLVVGAADTLIVNNHRSFAIPVRILDGNGEEVASTGPISTRWRSGDSLDLTADGRVTCSRNADAKVTLSSGKLETTALIRCRPVKSVHMAGPVQFLVGDSAQRLVAQVIGMDGKPVELMSGSVSIVDRSVAGAEGMKITPRSPGATQVTLSVGDASATTAIHVYEPLDAIVRLKQEQELVAVPLSLRSGELRKWELPPGTWMLTMTPYEDEKHGLRLTVGGANCVPELITPRRMTCVSAKGVSLTVSHPSKRRAPELTGRLLVRRVTS